MAREKLGPAQLASVAMLALALAAAVGYGSGRSLAHVGGPGRLVDPSAYGGDLIVVFVAVLAVAFGGIAMVLWPGRRRRHDDEAERLFEWEPPPWWTPWLVLLLAVAAIGALLLLPHHAGQPSSTQPLLTGPVRSTPHPATPAPTHSTVSPVHWWVLAVVGVLLVAAAILAVVLTRRGRSDAGELRDLSGAEELRSAVALSLDDIEREPDPRRAVIKAYGRMESALEGHGLGRRPFETSLEFLARSLGSLRVSGAAVGALTALFERAKFSRHEVDAAMKGEALAALVRLRDELEPER